MITGASDGIGRSIALALSKTPNCKLVLLGRNKQRLAEVQQACKTNGALAETHAFDLNDNVTREQTVSKILGQNQIDVLINNAGIWHLKGDLTTLSGATIQQVIDTNLTSQILLTKQVLPQIRNRQNSAIVNVSSTSGLSAKAGQSVYSASKWGMRGFTEVLREDTEGDAVKVSGVYQGGTNTGLFAKAGEGFSTAGFINPNDLADVIVFMLTRPESIWIDEVHLRKGVKDAQ
jgi:NADP-dependent 3-hydroxy acid dehydrogenase YdfG